MDTNILDHLTRVAAERGHDALWSEALPWIAETCQAAGARILVGLAAPIRHQHGQINEDASRAMDEWEEALLSLNNWVPYGRGSLSSLPPLPHITVDPSLPLVHLAIRRGQAVVGGLSLAFAGGARPSEAIVASASALTQSVANLADLATERYQMQRRLTQLNLLYEVSRAITSTLDVEAVLGYTTALAANTLGAMAASLILVDAVSQELVFSISHGHTAEAMKQRRMHISQGIAGWVVRTGQPVIVNDVARDSRYFDLLSPASDFTARNMICVPLQAKGATLGALEVLNREDGKDFDEEDLDWLTTLAAQASIAIDNARLYSSLREERDRIIETEEEVRRQLARNLHDGVSQVLSALMMNIEVTRRLASAGDGDLHTEFDFLRGLAQQANQEIRHTLHELRPLVLESQGLLAALEAHVAHQKQRNFEITLEARNLPHFDNRRTESAVFMIVQEGLNNVRKHAGADNVWLRLAVADSDLVVEIEDDGRGFDLNAAIANYGNSGSFGLLSMRERTERLDGTLTIKSPRDAGAGGTLVVLRVPLSRLS